MKINLFSLLVALIPLQVLSQVKVEREFRIDYLAAPVSASEWISTTFPGTKRGFKWFYEISGEARSYEAKFRWKGHRYSIKFDTTGVLQDVEIEIKWAEIQNALRQKFVNKLSQRFISHNVLRVQRQLLGNPEAIFKYISDKNVKDITINYELEIRGRKEAQNELWEVLFSSQGEILEIQVVRLHPTTNLDF